MSNVWKDYYNKYLKLKIIKYNYYFNVFNSNIYYNILTEIKS